MDILLNQSRSAQSVNVNNTLSIGIDNHVKILPYTDFTGDVNLKEVYDLERQSSTLLRLIITIHPYCTNVLFNNFTEIVRERGVGSDYTVEFIPYSGTGSSELLDYTSIMEGADINEFQPLEYKDTGFIWNAEEAIRDTQLSNSGIGFTYLCGLNIFNNHLLRKNTFKVVCKVDSASTYNNIANLSTDANQVSGDTDISAMNKFNTIEDYMREYDGKLVVDYSDIVFSESANLPRHLYLREEISTFKETVSSRLLEKNGWFGFINDSNIATYVDDTDEVPEELGIGRAINSAKACEFVYMYPTPELYSFTPQYNPHFKRIEKNWNYCLTYPSSSTTNMEFIEMAETRINNSGTTVPVNALKAASFYEDYSQLTVYSITKHGLHSGDTVNVYVVGDFSGTTQATRVLTNVTVTKIGDDDQNGKEYIFTISNGGAKISNAWAKPTNEDYKNGKFTASGQTYLINHSRNCVYQDSGGVVSGIKPIINGWVNLDSNHSKICFKKVINGVEVEYYVRIFSRLPNWKFAESAVTEYNVYDNPAGKGSGGKVSFLEKCQNPSNDFCSVNSDMSYAKTIYNDDVSQIVYTDDIDIAALHDNLGRPISEIFLTIVKNNKGYKEWYNDQSGANVDNSSRASDTIECSHAFGKVNCAFEYSNYSLYDSGLTNARILFNLQNNNGDKPNERLGLPIKKTASGGLNARDESGVSPFPLKDDEIDFYSDIHYYGDLCSYSTSNAMEESIEMVSFRFNTAQREMDMEEGPLSADIPKTIITDEIYTDDWDYSGFTMNMDSAYTHYEEARGRKEGYLYYPHYRIQVHSYSAELQSEYPTSYRVKLFDLQEDKYIRILTNRTNGFTGSDKLYLMRTDTSDIYEMVIPANPSGNTKTEFDTYSYVLNDKMFLCNYFDENGEDKTKGLYDELSGLPLNILRVLVPDPDIIPTYAKLIKDGGVRYAWRDLITNGYDNDSPLEQYPFTNGAFYISPRINFFLRRQDPRKEIKDWTFDGSGLHPEKYPFDPDGNRIDVDDMNTYYQEEDITC